MDCTCTRCEECGDLEKEERGFCANCTGQKSGPGWIDDPHCPDHGIEGLIGPQTEQLPQIEQHEGAQKGDDIGGVLR